jgi:uncharacterized membrane protein
MAKPFYVEQEKLLSILLTIVGAVLLLIAFLDFFGLGFTGMGAWDFWVGAAGAVLLLIGVIWLFSHLVKIKDFNRLINVQGKKALMQNLDELEYTAWRLPSKYDKIVAEKKKEHGL